MTTAVQHRRGTTAEHSTFTGLEGEVTIDTTKDTAVIHDGAQAGGYPLAKETLSNANPSTLAALDGASSASDDQFLVYDTSISQMKKMSRAELNNAITAEPFDTVDINGGTIDGTTIGATTRAAGNFTTLNANGNTTLGDASTDTVTVNGYMGLGAAPNSTIGLYVQPAALTGTAQAGIQAWPIATSAATVAIDAVYARAQTAAAAFTVTRATGFIAIDASKGAGSTITNLHGLYISDQTQGTNNYGVTSLVSSGTNKWNIYASGTAQNYFAGNVGVGTSAPDAQFKVVSSAPTNTIFDFKENFSNPGPLVAIRRRSDSPAAADKLGYLSFQGQNSIGNFIDYAGIYSSILSPTSGSEDGALLLYTASAGTPAERMRIDSAGNVGIGTSSPTAMLTVASSALIDTMTVGRGGQTSSTVVGAGATVSSTSATAIGNLAASVTGGVAVGSGASAGNVGVAIGSNASAGASAIAIGRDAVAVNNSVAIGRAATSGAANQLVFGSDTIPLNNMFLGRGVLSATPSNVSIEPTAGQGTDIAGANFTIVGGKSTGSGAGGSLIFSTAAAGASGTTLRTAAERMRIDSAGNVGIGTSAPATLLEVSASVDPVLRLNNSTNTITTGADIGEIQFYTNDASTSGTGIKSFIKTVAGPFGAAQGAASLVFGTTDNAEVNATERLRIDSSGNVGIGTTVPFADAPLHIRSVAGGVKRVLMQNSATTAGTQSRYDLATGTANSYSIMSLTESGTGNVTFELANGPGVNTGMFFSSGTTSAPIVFRQSTTERMRITSAGNVSIGGTANRATTVGTAALNIFNGTAPVGTLTNGISLYSSSGEAYVMDAAGNATLFSPHDAETNEWIFKSKHTPTGKVLKIDVEKMLRFINDHFGLDAIHEFTE